MNSLLKINKHVFKRFSKFQLLENVQTEDYIYIYMPVANDPVYIYKFKYCERNRGQLVSNMKYTYLSFIYDAKKNDVF